ncbi:Senescence regulator [Senna tora]|uniref:Senescence regulator n=1 Tax=Senna tora TaxID=362788 RepID=A0A834SQT0_9FABA|nr:Senescence regulator [Senna tora]
MATSKGYFARPSYRFLPGDRDRDSPTMPSDSVFEFDESDIYNNPPRPDFRKPIHASRIARKSSSSKLADSGARTAAVGTPASLPVNIPDWSKILGEEYRENRRRDDDGDSDDGSGGRVPPHEFLARTRMASFSVHEGVGRTLKGRDLSRVRNAIWAKTGFED